MSADTEILVGKVYSVVFNQEDYYILNFDALGHRSVKVKGNFHGIQRVMPNVPIKLIGKWKQNKKYGKEFLIQTWAPWAENAQDFKVFLNVCIPGFADLRLVDAIVDAHGLSTIEKLTYDSAAILSATSGIVAKETVERALYDWDRSIATRDLSGILREGGLGATDVQMALARFGSDAPKVISDNPFRLMEILGFSFPKIDRLASYLGIKPNDPRRVQGVVLWTLQEASKQGHLYLRRGELVASINDLLNKERLIPVNMGEDPAKTCDWAVSELLRQKAATLDAGAGLYLTQLYEYERKSADYLSKLLTPAPPIDVDTKAFIEEYERAHHIKLSDAQCAAVELLTQKRVLAITGLPGTGKTTVLKTFVRLLEQAGISFSLTTPTGIASKRLAAVTGHNAMTIHRALRYDGNAWGLNENNRYVTDAVILDEASMMDQELFYRLLCALRPDTRLVLVGDAAQLPSVGPGNVLRELIDCKSVPHVQLTEIFRQAVQGEIVVNSHRINSGQLPFLDNSNPDSEFRFVRISDEQRIVDLIVQMAIKLKARDANFQVLSPKYDGTVGVDNLNERLREVLNPPGSKEWAQGSLRFREGDRLMVVQNDYKLNVYNGDVGKLTHIGRDNLVVKIHGVGANAMNTDVVFTNELAERKLKLAYAITAHKSQGSEFDTIIIPIVNTQGRMLQRNLLYTAVTRAKKKVWLIGEEAAIQRAIDNNKVVKRNTVLARAVTDSLAVVSVTANGVSNEARAD